jgi:ATP-dependent RNA helicase DDX10/DBP4
LEGLALAKLTIATEIQAAAIPHALAGRDILGAAKTGSGKTLSFVIPLIEKLYIERWGPGDGLAAVIITPTRELAMQIFEVLRVVGKKHSFSAGLITGGRKDFEGEQERISGMNILVATPGRFLQHLEQTAGFDASQVMVLVLDEADRILDMGFKAQLDTIVQYLPRERQTVLFSATQTKSVKDLARLSLNNPEYLAVHAEDSEVTPKQLIQNYIVCKLPEKLDILFSFIKTHLKCKMIVFFSTCSQVRYVYECFRAMQPGIPLSCLHGKIKQERRTMIYVDFTRRKHACMLCTDIAARGLDFPSVDWVVQADAPEDAAMYVHRVGRTARYNADGRALLMVMPSEEGPLMQNLTDAHVPIKKLTVNPTKRFTVAVKAAALLAAQPELKSMAKKAFTGYLHSLQLLPGGRAITDPCATLPAEEYASALGLAFAPTVPAIASAKLSDPEAAREENRGQKNVNR